MDSASVPQHLDAAIDDQNNYVARFVRDTITHFAHRVDDWIIWNDVDFRENDGGPGTYTWAGSPEAFTRLLKVGYLAAKAANSQARVSFSGVSYWVDFLGRRPLFYDQVLSLLASDPAAAANNDFHDAVALNLYHNPDAVYQTYWIFKQFQHDHGIDKPIWLTETNAMPTEDPGTSVQCEHKGFRVTLDEQAGFAIQVFAIAAAAGYERVGFYKMVDDAPCEPELHGVTRFPQRDARPVLDSLRTAFKYFTGFTQATFRPLVRAASSWPAWPEAPTSQIPNWQVYQVALDHPDGRRVTILWNGVGAPVRVSVPRHGTTARLVDRGGEVELTPTDAGWVIDLPAATAYLASLDPDGYHFIGGDPRLIVEKDVGPGAPIDSPQLVGADSN